MNPTTSHTLVAVFRDRQAADAAVEDLRSNGFSAAETLSSEASSSVYTGEKNTHHEGGIVGWFKRLFGEGDNPDRTSYERALNEGQYLVTAYVDDDQVDRAADILNQHSPANVERDAQGSDIDDTAYAAGAGTAAYDTAAYDTARSDTARYDTTDTSAYSGQSTFAKNTAADATASARNFAASEKGSTTGEGENRTIPVVQEELKVGKRSFQRGGVRVYSRIVEQPVEEQVRLREERVSVDRVPADRATQAGDLQAGREQVYEVKEFAEEPVVSKQARVVEEVRVGKQATERVETVRDTVRKTEVNVENLGQEAGTAASNAYATARGSAGGNVASTGYGSNDDYYRQNFATQAEYTGQNYDDYAPAYQYGETIAADPRYTGRSWNDIEPQIRSDYAQRYPNSAWDKMKNAVRTGWNRVSAKAKKV